MTIQRPDKPDPWLIAKLSVMVLVMFAFGFALVPLYDVFCDITGFGGRTNTVAVAADAFKPDTERSITIEFVGTVNRNAPWVFRPVNSSMVIHPGEPYDATFFAKSLASKRRIGQAVPSVSPGRAAEYFLKIDCFCFEQQTFASGEEKYMDVRFVVDPEIPDYIDTITLAYTMFDTVKTEDGRLKTEGKR